MAKVIYLDSVAGVAGDMFTAAFVDAGLVSVDELNRLPEQLGLTGVHIAAENVIRATVAATRIVVETTSDEWKTQFADSRRHAHGHGPGHEHHHHHHPDDNTNLILDQSESHWHVHYGQIDTLLERSKLDGRVRERSRAIFRSLGEAEAGVHAIELREAAFHELGTIDSIMDVVMAAYCIERIAADDILATPIKPGRGSITIAHGTHPVPPPATARLLIGMTVASTPAAITHENIELSTPTGVAILKELSPQFVSELPSGTIVADGRGSGTRDLGSYPNIFRLVVVNTSEETRTVYNSDRVVEIVCNVDDDTGEHLAWMCEELLARGALDVWQTAGTGKKGRSMICLSVLVRENDLAATAEWILQNGTTFGVRYRAWDRLKLDTAFEERTVDGKRVTVKIGLDGAGNKTKEKIEFESWRAVR